MTILHKSFLVISHFFFSPLTLFYSSTGTSTKAFLKGVETWNKETIMKKVSFNLSCSIIMFSLHIKN